MGLRTFVEEEVRLLSFSDGSLLRDLLELLIQFFSLPETKEKGSWQNPGGKDPL